VPSSSTRNRRKWEVEREPTIEIELAFGEWRPNGLSNAIVVSSNTQR